MSSISKDKEAGVGLGCGILAYLMWGGFPVYFKSLGSVPSLQVVAHRVVWSLLFLFLLILVWGRSADVWTALKSRRTLLILVTTAFLIAANWLIFVIAIDHAQILQASLGYFITPFFSVFLGFLFLKERLRRMQLFGLLLATCGVLLITVQFGHIPWAALTLALTFSCYGLLRKIVAVDALVGLTVETLLVAPVAVAYLVFVSLNGAGSFPLSGIKINSLLMFSGIVTAVPLLLFATAARRLKLATVGFLQYLAPTLQFLLAVLVYNELFTLSNLCSFMLIWCGIFFYSVDAWLAMKIYRSALS
ncbi:MAG: EamA family transporter RarD [Desulfuromonadaceae bacterium]|nr:EamA family transporter RarD [Desulfuromonadaceae bacterium]MDD2849015.1 EamA family transporter RarD [Desulfuromonadaceae bacterium]MDD4131828.1 EamA family transporter RarD [Desulfuromonadaceae bacterium]